MAGESFNIAASYVRFSDQIALGEII